MNSSGLFCQKFLLAKFVLLTRKWIILPLAFPSGPFILTISVSDFSKNLNRTKT